MIMNKRNCPECGATIPAKKDYCFRCRNAAKVKVMTPPELPADEEKPKKAKGK